VRNTSTYEENLIGLMRVQARPGGHLESLFCVVYMRELLADLNRKVAFLSIGRAVKSPYELHGKSLG
jgi:hypothetical protein